MPVLFRNIRSGKRKIALEDLVSTVRKEIEDTIDTKVKPALIKSHELVVAKWEHKPKFSSRKYIKPDSIAVNIFATGDNAKIWGYVNDGTKPHVIRAKNAPLLKFRTGYSPKTLAKPARTVPSGGTASGPWVSKVAVNHPGNEARNFTNEIAEDIKPDFKIEIENAFRRASNAMKE